MNDILPLIVTSYADAPAVTRFVAHVSLFIGVLGTFIALARAVFLARASSRLHRIIRRPEFEAPIPSGEDADGLEELWDEIRAEHLPHAFREALERMERARSRPIGLPEEVWKGMHEVALAAEARWETFVRSAAYAAVLVGLLGTVAGFADIAQDLAHLTRGTSANAGVSDNIVVSDALEHGLRGVFVSTICGILAALAILMLGAPALRLAGDRWLAVGEDAGRLVIIPALPRPPTRIQDLLLEELHRRLSTISAAWESALRQPAAALAGTADSAARAADTALQALGELKVSVEDLNELGRSARRIKDASHSIEQTAKTYVSASVRLEGAVTRLQTTLPAINTGMEALTSQLSLLERAYGSGTQAVAEGGENLRQAVAQLAGDFRALEQAVSARHGQQTEFLEQTQRAFVSIGTRLGDLTTVEKRLADQSGEMLNAVSGLGRTLTQVLGPLEKSITEAISGTFGKLVSDHNEVLTTSILELQKTITGLHSEVSATENTLGRLRESQVGLSHAQDALAGAAGTITADTHTIADAASRLAELRTALERFTGAVEHLARSGIPMPPEHALTMVVANGVKQGLVEGMRAAPLTPPRIEVALASDQIETDLAAIREIAESLRRPRATVRLRRLLARLWRRSPLPDAS